jgi:hypothetical protein
MSGAADHRGWNDRFLNRLLMSWNAGHASVAAPASTSSTGFHALMVDLLVSSADDAMRRAVLERRPG